MGWLLEVADKDGNDLYPEIKKRAKEKNATEKHGDMVRYDYIDKLGYYCTESSEHNAEYNGFYIKSRYPERDFEIIEQINGRTIKRIQYERESATSEQGSEILDQGDLPVPGDS